MKSALLSLILLILSPLAFAERIQGEIDSIDYGKKNQDHIIKMSSGRVIFVKPDSGLISTKTSYDGVPVEIDVDSNNNLKGIYSLPDESVNDQEERAIPSEKLSQTDLPSEAEASRIFSGMNRSYYSNTECTDRAHVWTYEELKKNSLISRKVFLFFTNTYIRKYRYHWWFHVSPYVLVQGVERVMDRRYTSSPRYMKSWTDIFIRSKKTCPVNTYRYYRSNKNGPEHCVLVKADMYYRLPYHVRMKEDYGRVKTKFNTSEVNGSYRAFRRRGVRN
ncbi:MAG: protein-glutamine glutaminase family protein [Bdellovibrionota bacterium]